MIGPIGVDLEDAQQCSALKMIKYLLAFCISKDEGDPECDEELLAQAFEKVKEIAKCDKTPLTTQLSEL
jgi:hypothetical protein